MENTSTHKTEVCGSSPQWPTKSVVLEELPIRELLMMLLGEEGWRKKVPIYFFVTWANTLCICVTRFTYLPKRHATYLPSGQRHMAWRQQR
jgi:hypothetical protein